MYIRRHLTVCNPSEGHIGEGHSLLPLLLLRLGMEHLLSFVNWLTEMRFLMITGVTRNYEDEADGWVLVYDYVLFVLLVYRIHHRQ